MNKSLLFVTTIGKQKANFSVKCFRLFEKNINGFYLNWLQRNCEADYKKIA